MLKESVHGIQTIIKKHKRAVQYGICAVFLIITGLIYLAGRKNASVSENTFADNVVSSSIEDSWHMESESSFEDIYVYICGHVNCPGVVKCLKGTRLYEAVAMAGGADDSADMSAVNLGKDLLLMGNGYIFRHMERIFLL